MKHPLPLLVALALVPACWHGESTDGDTAPDIDVDTDSDADSDTDIDSDSDTDADTDADGDTDSDTDSDADTDIDADTDTDADIDTDIDTVTDSPNCPFECMTEILCYLVGGMVFPYYTCEGSDICCDTGEDTGSDVDTDADTDDDTDSDTPDCPFECMTVTLCNLLDGVIHSGYECEGTNVCCEQDLDTDTATD